MESTSEDLFLAAMLECSDERQVRTHYAVPGAKGSRAPRPLASDRVSLMVACADPRQVRFGHEGHAARQAS